jgi:hypothetical protein
VRHELGDIFYWIGCVIAALIAVLVAVFLELRESGPDSWTTKFIIFSGSSASLSDKSFFLRP